MGPGPTGAGGRFVETPIPGVACDTTESASIALKMGVALNALAASCRCCVSTVTARKWLGRYLAQGQPALADRTSHPLAHPRFISPAKALNVIELRKKRMTQIRIAAYLGLSTATVSRLLQRAGLSSLADLDPVEPMMRYAYSHAGDRIHLDTKKLVRIERPGHHVHGVRTTRAAVRAGKCCLWPSVTMPALPLPGCTAMKPRKMPSIARRKQTHGYQVRAYPSRHKLREILG